MTALEWSPELPADWKVEQARRVLRRVKRPVRTDDQTVTAFRDGEVTLRSNRRTEGFTEAFAEFGYHGVREGDLAIHAMDGFAGAIGVSDSDGKVSPVVHLYDAGLGDARFFAYALREAARAGFVTSLAKGIRERSTSFDPQTLAAMDLPVPQPIMQRRIADYLDRETATIDALIEKQRQLVDGLRERSEALVRSGIFGKEQGAARADRWIPNLPAGWSIEPLRRHTALVNGSTPNRTNPDYWQGGQHAWLNSSHANSDVVVTADQWVTDAAVEECHLPRLCPGTVLVAITGQGKTRGKATLLTIRATINQHLAGILPEARQWDARFLTLMLRAAYDELRLVSDAGGSTRGALTLSSLGNVLVARPSLAEQREIADHLDRETAKIDTLIAKAERFIELAQERRAALITAAVTGQIEIPTED